MEVMVYNHVQPRESLAEFNARLFDYCKNNTVAGIDLKAVGPSVVLTFLLADEMAEQVEHAVFPVVMPVSGLDAELEEQLSEFIQSHTPPEDDEEPEAVPVVLGIVPRGDDPNKAYAVLQLIHESFEYEEV